MKNKEVNAVPNAVSNTGTTVEATPKYTIDIGQKWLSNRVQDFLMVSEAKANEYDKKYQDFINIQKEVINTILISMYDKDTVYAQIKADFKEFFKIECRFTNKMILKEIIKSSMQLFKMEVSPELNNVFKHSDYMIDFDFSHWLFKDDSNKFIRADDNFINAIPQILANLDKILSHNAKETAEKVYRYNGAKVTKTMLKDFIKAQTDISVISHTLQAVIEEYNESYNINSILAKALKGYDKMVLVKFLSTITPEMLKDMADVQEKAKIEKEESELNKELEAEKSA